MWRPPEYMLNNQRTENNPIHVTANRRPAGRSIYIIPLTAAALALLVATSRVNARNITPYHADLNKDKIVNFLDFAKLANNWQKTGQGDFNKDGVVDFNDVGSLTNHWLGTWIPIRTSEDVNNIRNDLAACYVLVADVNAYPTTTWNNGRGLKPIGGDYPDDPFTGSFIGNGHSIIGIYINRPSEYNVGLFGMVDLGALITNLRIENGHIVGKSSVGSVAGTVEDGKITRTSVSGTVEAHDQEGGGIAGKIYRGTITDCLFRGYVTGDSYLGGIIGGGSSPDPNAIVIIARSYSKGKVNGRHTIGGLAGEISDSIITYCFATNNVEGRYHYHVGGLVGDNMDDSAQTINSFFTDPNHHDPNNPPDPNLYGTYQADPNGDVFYYDPNDPNSKHDVYKTWDFNDVWLPDANGLPTLRGQGEPEEALTEEQITKNNNDQKPNNHKPNIHLLLRQEPHHILTKNQQLNRRRLPTRAFNHKTHYRRA